MGFAAAEVRAGVAELLAARGLVARGLESSTMDDRDGCVFQVGDVRIAIGPLPDERRTPTLFHPRCLLVLTGEGPLAEALKSAIRVKFLRVTG